MLTKFNPINFKTSKNKNSPQPQPTILKTMLPTLVNHNNQIQLGECVTWAKYTKIQISLHILLKFDL